MTDADKPHTIYVAMCQDIPIGVSEHRGDVQAATEQAFLQYKKPGTDIRWEEDVALACWRLYSRNPTTLRWNKSMYHMVATVILDALGTDDLS